MRLSIQPDSPFYNSHITRGVHCFLDGQLLEHCVEACEEEGWALQTVRTTDDKPVFHEGRIKTRKLVGRVEFRPKHPIDERTAQVIEILRGMIKEFLTGKSAVESLDAASDTIDDNAIGDEWLNLRSTGRFTYTIVTVAKR